MIQNLISNDHVTVCICTYKRPQMLSNLLSKLQHQITDNLFTYSIVIVDNDSSQSALSTVDEWQRRSHIQIDYYFEPEQNIALARNKAVENAKGNFIAMIDDDEVPVKDWLVQLYSTLRETGADGVLGPVLPFFPEGAPEWLKKSGLCDRPRNKTGSPITGKDLRTGNILFSRCVFDNDEKWFDASRGLSGGEDGEFLIRQLNKGCKFIWCDEAPAFEMVPEERWPASYYLRREFSIGTITGNKMRHSRKYLFIVKPVVMLLFYSICFPLSFIIDKHVWMRFLVKVYYNAGCVFSFFSLVSVQQR